MSRAVDTIIKASVGIVKESATKQVEERTLISETLVDLKAPKRVTLLLPEYVSWYDVYFSVQKLVDGVWQFGNVSCEQTLGVGGEPNGRRITLPEAGNYKLIQSWKRYVHCFTAKLPVPAVISVAGRHPTLKAFNIVELGSAQLFEKFDPRWLMYGQYGYLVQLNVPARFDDNIHVHFGVTFDIQLRDSTHDLNTWLNVFSDGATLLVWDKNSLDILLAACERTVTSGNPDHRVDAEVTVMVRPEAVWSLNSN